MLFTTVLPSTAQTQTVLTDESQQHIYPQTNCGKYSPALKKKKQCPVSGIDAWNKGLTDLLYTVQCIRMVVGGGEGDQPSMTISTKSHK